VNTLTSPALVEHETVELIARVLGRAHRTTEQLEAPNDARTILQVAHLFADELASFDPDFDRLKFIQDVTEDPRAAIRQHASL
jgi:predicted nucleic acid-binding protein